MKGRGFSESAPAILAQAESTSGFFSPPSAPFFITSVALVPLQALGLVLPIQRQSFPPRCLASMAQASLAFATLVLAQGLWIFLFTFNFSSRA